jgi:ribose 5-phosphate isomerase A
MDARDRAAQAAVAEVKDGMVVGLGTGDTAARAVRALAGRAIEGVPTSQRTAELARSLGIRLREPNVEPDLTIDLTIDGADEVDPLLRLVKGGGGALTREKLVARASKRLLIVVDEEKRVSRLGETRRLPVEILAFGARWTMKRLRELDPRLREGFVTENGGLVIDCLLVGDPAELARRLDATPGVIEHGLFLEEASVVYVGGREGVVTLARV